MSRTPEHAPGSDQAKAFTPDKLRNDKGHWRDRDQPDDPPAGADPERDYPDATVPAPRRR